MWHQAGGQPHSDGICDRHWETPLDSLSYARQFMEVMLAGGFAEIGPGMVRPGAGGLCVSAVPARTAAVRERVELRLWRARCDMTTNQEEEANGEVLGHGRDASPQQLHVRVCVERVWADGGTRGPEWPSGTLEQGATFGAHMCRL